LQIFEFVDFFVFAAGSRSTKNIGSGSLLTLCLMFIIFLAVCP
jgi:hypothetical protein